MPVAIARTHSAPARVLPAPLPPNINQIDHGGSGGNWSGRAQVSQSLKKVSRFAPVRAACRYSIVFALLQFVKAVRKFVAEGVDIFWWLIVGGAHGFILFCVATFHFREALQKPGKR